jgi:MFS family permease
MNKHSTIGSAQAPAMPHKATLPVILLALATVISAVSSLMVALPSIAVHTHASQTELSWIVDAYSLAFAALLLPGGALGDRIGRRRVLVGGMALFTVASFLPLFTSSPDVLIAVRACLGVAAAVVMPATLSTITAGFPPQQRVKAVATWAGVAGAGAIFGLLASGLVLEWWSWRAVFVVSGVMALITLIGTLAFVPESAAPHDASRDAVGSVISVAGLAVLVYSIIEAPTHGWASARTLVGIAIGLVVIALFLLWETRVSRPLLAPKYFRIHGFWSGSLSLTAQFFAFFGFIMVFMQELQLLRGYSGLLAACAMLPLGAGLMPAARGLAPRLAAKMPPARLSAIGLALAGVAVIGLSQADSSTPYWALAIGLWLLGTGSGLAMPPATSAITSALPAAQQGVASAMNDLSRELGGAIGIAVLSSVLASTYRQSLNLAAVPDRLHRLVESSGAAAMHAPAPAIRSMATAAYSNGIQTAILTAGIILLVAAVAMLVSSGRPAAR